MVDISELLDNVGQDGEAMLIARLLQVDEVDSFIRGYPLYIDRGDVFR